MADSPLTSRDDRASEQVRARSTRKARRGWWWMALVAALLAFWWSSRSEHWSARSPSAGATPVVDAWPELDANSTDVAEAPRSGTRQPAPLHAPIDSSVAAIRPGTTAVRGRVVDPSGAPLPNAEVQVEVLQDFAGVHAGAKAAQASTTKTDSSGAFVFESLSAFGQELDLRVRCEGWASERLVFAARWGSVIDLGDITLTRGSRVHGVVLDESGARVPEVNVYGARDCEVWRLPGTRGERIALADSNGEFTLGPLAPGAYRFCAERDDFISEWSAPVHVAADAAPATATLQGWWGVPVDGKVLDMASGAPLQANVTFAPHAGLRGHHALTQADGSFRIRGCRVGLTYTFVASAAGYSTNTGVNAHTVLPPVEGEAELTIQLRKLGARQVQVVDATTGKPVEQAEVRSGLVPNGLKRQFLFHAELLASAPILARTGSDGFASIVDPADSRLVCVTATGYSPQLLLIPREESGAEAASGPDSVVRCALTRGARVRVEIRGDTASAPIVGPWNVELRAARRPVRRSPAFAGEDEATPAPVLRALALHDGALAEFENVAAGEFDVVSTSPNGGLAFGRVSVNGEEDVFVALNAVPAASVSARVAGASASPLRRDARFLVTLTDRTGAVRKALVRPGGSCQFAGLSPGAAVLVLSTTTHPWLPMGTQADGAYTLSEESIELNPGLNELELRAAETLASLSGVVLSNGQAAPGLDVSVFAVSTPREQHFLARRVTDDDGRFELSPIPPGAYRIILSNTSLRTGDVRLADQRCEVEPLDARAVIIELRSGALRLSAGTDDARASLRFQVVNIAIDVDPSTGATPVFTSEVQLDGNAAAHVRHLREGQYLLRISGRDTAADLRFSITPGEVTAVTL